MLSILTPFIDMMKKAFKNGYYKFESKPDFLIDILVIACIVGVFLSLFGNRKWGSKLTLGSIGIAMLWMVITSV